MIRLSLCTASACLALCTPAARADVVFDSFDTNGGFGPQLYTEAAGALNGIVVTADRMAVQFTVCGAGYTLDSVTIPIGRQANGITTELLRIRITDDAAGSPGATLETLSENQPTPADPGTLATATTYTSATHPSLVRGRTYWVVAELTAMPTFTGPGTSVMYHWHLNTSGATVLSIRQTRVNAGLPQDPWPAPTTDAAALRVNGTSVSSVVCCNPSTHACAVMDPQTCTALNLTVIPASTSCTPNPCPPACAADFNHVGGLSTQDIFDFLAAWFAGC